MPPVGSVPDPRKLSPEMVSFRALVLAFVRDYLTEWGQSPSYGEIAAGTGSNPTRAKRAVRSLAKEGLLIRTPGTRGLSLPDEIERARITLKRAGLLPAHPPSTRSRTGEAGTTSAAVGQQERPVPKSTLLPPPALDYPAGRSRSRRGKRRNGASGSEAG